MAVWSGGGGGGSWSDNLRQALADEIEAGEGAVAEALGAAFDARGYLLACFRQTAGAGGDQQLSILFSQDGKTFEDGAGKRVATGAQIDPTSTVVRDPSILWRNGVFFICYTRTGSTGTSFNIGRSVDLVNWTLVTTVSMASIGSVGQTWAPEFVVDENDDVYIFVSINVTNPYWLKATSADLSTWTAPTLLTITGRPAGVIDPVFIKRGSTWYCFYKREDATPANRLIYRATSSSLTGTYVTDKTGDWAGWGSNVEGPSVIQLHDGGYRIYFDEPANETAGMGFYYSDSADLTTWSARQPVNLYPAGGARPRHGSVLPVRGEVFHQIMAPRVGAALADVSIKNATISETDFVSPRATGDTPNVNGSAAGVYLGAPGAPGSYAPKTEFSNGVKTARIEFLGGSYFNVGMPGDANSWLQFSTTKFSPGSPLQIKRYTTATRPAAGLVGDCVIYDSDLGMPIYSNGTSWRKFDGTAA